MGQTRHSHFLAPTPGIHGLVLFVHRLGLLVVHGPRLGSRTGPAHFAGCHFGFDGCH